MFARVKGKTMVSPDNNYFKPVMTNSNSMEKHFEQLKNSPTAMIDF
jgi:hypothetical protein